MIPLSVQQESLETSDPATSPYDEVRQFNFERTGVGEYSISLEVGGHRVTQEFDLVLEPSCQLHGQ